jgi:hypothetical protein
MKSDIFVQFDVNDPFGFKAAERKRSIEKTRSLPKLSSLDLISERFKSIP